MATEATSQHVYSDAESVITAPDLARALEVYFTLPSSSAVSKKTLKSEERRLSI